MIRGVLQSITETADKVRRFIAAGRVREVIRNGALYQHYSLVSDPPAGTKIITDGHSGIEVSIAEDNPSYRPQLKSIDGAAAFYCDADHYILWKKDGSILIKTDQAVTIESGDIRLGSATELLLNKLVDARIVSAHNSHYHAVTTDPVTGIGATAVPTVPIVESTVTTSKVRGQ